MTPEEETLLLWKTLSELPDTYTIRKVDKFKNNISIRIGIGKRLCGCPLCHSYLFDRNCPIGKCGGPDNLPACNSTPYAKWKIELDNGMHIQSYAKEFYIYLKEKLCIK